ncbi:MAG: transposon-encoded TnpW family protein, partial [Muribaculum sp.]|nr:transposon-encoded TnpW family protein [Muribaculum sp.]
EESRYYQASAGKAQRLYQSNEVRFEIGNTTYDVSFHYSRQSRESMNDKIIRLIENDMQCMKKD